MKKLIPVVLLLAIVLLTGCLSAQEQYEAEFWATQNAESGVIPPAKYLTLAATAYNLRLTATPSPYWTPTINPNHTPTPNEWQYAQTQAAQVQYNMMTSEAQQQAYELQKWRAEQAAQAARETAQAHAEAMTAQARATYMQGTANAEGTRVQGTAYAQATTTERAMLLNAQGTGTAGAMTAAIQPTSDSLTLQAAKIQQTIEAGEAEQVELAVKRQAANNYFDAYLPWVIILALTYVFGSGFMTWVKIRTHPRDEHGRMQTFTRELPNGGVVMVRPETLETGIVKISNEGEVIRYAPMDKGEQSDINRRSQAIEAIAALPTPYAAKGPQLLSGEFGRSTPRVSLNNDPGLRPVLDEADSQFLEEGGSDAQ